MQTSSSKTLGGPASAGRLRSAACLSRARPVRSVSLSAAATSSAYAAVLAPPADSFILEQASNVLVKPKRSSLHRSATEPRLSLQAPTWTPFALHTLALGLQALHDETACELGAVCQHMRVPQGVVDAMLLQAHRQRLPLVYQPRPAPTPQEEALTAAAAIGSWAQQQRVPPVLLKMATARRLEAEHRMRFPKVRVPLRPLLEAAMVQ